eukprot:s7004_g1.t1
MSSVRRYREKKPLSKDSSAREPALSQLFGSSLPRCSPGGLRNGTLLRMWWYGPSPYHGYGHDWWGPPRYYRDRYDRDRKWDREQDKDKEGKPADRPRSEDGEKGKEANSGPALELARKPYRQIIDELIKNTVLCRNDFDHKILLLLDALWERNKLQDACSHVKKVVEVLPRDKEQDESAIVVRLVELEEEEEEWVRGMKRKKDKERDLQKEERE